MKEHLGKYIFGVVKVSDKGQIVIPKDARLVFGIKPGDTMLLVGDIETGLALIRQGDVFDKLLSASAHGEDK